MPYMLYLELICFTAMHFRINISKCLISHVPIQLCKLISSHVLTFIAIGLLTGDVSLAYSGKESAALGSSLSCVHMERNISSCCYHLKSHFLVNQLVHFSQKLHLFKFKIYT